MSASISFHHPFNRAGGRTSNVRQKRMQSLRYTKASWPIPHEELIARRDQCAKLETKWVVVQMIVFFILLGAMHPLGKWIDGPNSPEWLTIVWVVVLSAIVIGNMLLFNITIANRMRTFDLACPNCFKILDKIIFSGVLATGKCCNCRTSLVSNPSRENKPRQSNPYQPPRFDDFP
jgi:hypothetical protein